MTTRKSFKTTKQKLQNLVSDNNIINDQLAKKEQDERNLKRTENIFRVPIVLVDTGWIIASPGGIGG